ncbi:ubiE/COQ5 methyltransferase family-domain-containing protein [Paraphysoderma sedebokerense]|nr:ubiE/COQ5 methyltransferase family-domain-containing protein [Paraphysoderma sedebokerense]
MHCFSSSIRLRSLQSPLAWNAASFIRFHNCSRRNGHFDAGQSKSNQNAKESSNEGGQTHFGFQTVPENMKEMLVGKVFENVASKYDVMNDAMSFGVHRFWKNYFMQRLAPGPSTKLLDVAGGTGDIALRFLDYVRSHYGGLKSANVTVLDINPAMLEVGKQRFSKLGFQPENDPHVSFQVGNAEDLSDIPSESMDAYTIAFGIRNCTHIDKVIGEAYRVLKPGGRFMCLEFGKVDNPVVGSLYDIYSFQVIPELGQLIASDRASYQYLVESIRKFPSQPEFTLMMKDKGFKVVGSGYEDLTFGVASIWTGFKL